MLVLLPFFTLPTPISWYPEYSVFLWHLPLCPTEMQPSFWKPTASAHVIQTPSLGSSPPACSKFFLWPAEDSLALALTPGAETSSQYIIITNGSRSEGRVSVPAAGTPRPWWLQLLETQPGREHPRLLPSQPHFG